MLKRKARLQQTKREKKFKAYKKDEQINSKI